MKHLSADQVRELREELERQLVRLEKSARASEEAARPVELDQTAVGRLSRMDSLQNQSLSANLRDREQARLGLIRRALERLADGSYGVCLDCGEGVAFGRLFVVPESPTCGRCGGGGAGP